VNSLNNDKASHVHVRAVVTYPAAMVALVASMALALTSFGPSQVSALAATTTPTATATPSATVMTTPAPAAAPTVATSPAPTPVPGLVVAPGAAFGDHHMVAQIEGSSFQATYLRVDEPVPDASPFQTFRVRFRLHNAGTAPITQTPRLEFRAKSGAGFAVVPQQPEQGIPFFVAREWIPSLGLGGGTKEGPLGEDITVADLRIGTEGGLAVIGHRSMGANPDRPVTLPSDSYTEEEFTFKLSIDAKFLTGYELRITDAGTPLTGTDVATIRLGAPPAVHLSPDQRQGVAVVSPKDTKPVPSSAGSAFPSAFAPPSSASSSVAAVSATTLTSTMSYPLVTIRLPATIAPADDQIHGLFSMSTDKCGICHRTHTAKAPNLLANGSKADGSKSSNLGSQSTLCLSCHSGTGAKPDAGMQYGLVRPVNVPATRDYYSHDALDANPSTQHTQSQLNEFGSVDGVAAPPLNRHSECTDCHNPHKATVSTTRDATQNTDGWGVSGRLTGVSGVSVVNGTTADSVPTYTFLDGTGTGTGAMSPVTREYQICFKCHSGFTTLTSNADVSANPSKYALDKAVEFNPANPSFHPVEAQGTNQTAKMTASLAGTSPYKLWNFETTSTIRCLNCHASSATPGGTPPLPAIGDPSLPLPGSALAPHTSVNRGILLRNYRDRVLKPAAEAYSAGDFALCYTCHAETPFANSAEPFASTATNFRFHGLHLTAIAGGNPGTDIDKAGDGSGLAICAECHFRLHSTTNKVPQDVDGSRLVNFAPNVTAAAGLTTPLWKSTGTGGGTCSVTCHGYSHTRSYDSP
jgi:predicted CXXCH cytochrome family protein